jgi:hypothetical protein
MLLAEDSEEPVPAATARTAAQDAGIGCYPVFFGACNAMFAEDPVLRWLMF